jgi:hypothetical protein
VQSVAKKLNFKLSLALNELRHTKELKQQALKAHLNAFTQLLRLEKVYEKVQSKEFYLVE